MVNNKRNFQIIRWASLFAIALGLLVLSGWLFNIALFKTVVPNYVSMKLNTVIFFLLTSTILLLFVSNKWQKLGKFFSVALLIFAFTTLYQDIFGINLGIDQLFIDDLDALQKKASSPGRPSPTTSFCFMLFGFALLLINNSDEKIKRIVQYTFHTITLASFIAIVGYLFNVPVFYKLSIFTSMAIHTSATLFILSAAISLANPNLGITKMFFGDKIGNLMARTLEVKILATVLILGFVQLQLNRFDVVNVEFGVALFTTCFILVAMFFLGSTVQLLNAIDTKRNEAEMALVSTNKNLEHKVTERTVYLTKQNKQLEDFAHIVSHNLRGPVSNLKTLLSFYKIEKDEDEKTEIMDKFDITVNNLEVTLNELLEVVTIKHGSKKEKELLDFEMVISKLIQTYQGKIMETKAKITYDFSAAETLEYSSVYLESIMQNLLSNAIKYRSLERNPVIHFKTDIVNNKPCLNVTDNGLGINMERNGSKLFGLHKTFHKHPEANGVGLFITKAQVEAMGGEISAESEVGKGTTFKITF